MLCSARVQMGVQTGVHTNSGRVGRAIVVKGARMWKADPPPSRMREKGRYSSVAMMARRVSMPSPFSEDVTTSSG